MTSYSKRILVIGPSKVGKTSMISALTGTSYQGTSMVDHANRPQISIGDGQYHNILYQFINVKDPYSMINNRVDEADISKYFTEILERVHAGLCLILYVCRSGTIHQTSWDIYSLFANIICDNKLPVVGIITHCENEEPMSTYISVNQINYTRNGFRFNDIVATCFVRGGPLEKICRELREESTQKVWRMIETYSSRENIDVADLDGHSTDFPAHRSSLLDYLSLNLFKKEKNNNENATRQTIRPYLPNASPKNMVDAQDNSCIDRQCGSSAFSSSIACVSQTDMSSVQLSSPASRRPPVKLSTALLFEGCSSLLSSEKKKFSEWLSSRFGPMHLIFNARCDGRNVKTFHEKCDNKGPTVTTIHVHGGYVFGGYTRKPWSSHHAEIWDSEAVLFTLKNPHNLGPTCYETNHKSERPHITHNPQLGPVFGTGSRDITVESDKKGNFDSVIINFPQSFTDITKYGCKTFTGGSKAKINDLQVFECVTGPLIHQ